MTGTPSNIALASNALLLLGHETIASFTEGTAGATIASNLYENSYLSQLTNHRWGFATKQQQLARCSTSPVDGYTYAYVMPSDCIYLIKADTRNYRVYGHMVYTNATTLYIDYIYRVDEVNLPPYFTKMFEFFLAAQFALPLTGDIKKGEYYSRMYLNELKRAKFADSTQSPQDTFIDSPYTEVRY